MDNHKFFKLNQNSANRKFHRLISYIYKRLKRIDSNVKCINASVYSISRRFKVTLLLLLLLLYDVFCIWTLDALGNDWVYV